MAACGPWVTGVIYDRTGNYELPFMIFTGLVVFALLCLTQVRPLPESLNKATPQED